LRLLCKVVVRVVEKDEDEEGKEKEKEEDSLGP
jgi:hypothetical protein